MAIHQIKKKMIRNKVNKLNKKEISSLSKIELINLKNDIINIKLQYFNLKDIEYYIELYNKIIEIEKLLKNYN